MAESRSESKPSSLKLILELFDSASHVHANQSEMSDYDKLFGGLSWCISTSMSSAYSHLNLTTQNKEKKPVILNEMEVLRERIDKLGVHSIVQELASLLKASKSLERQGSSFQSTCTKKQSRLISEIAELEEKLQNGNLDSDLSNYLDHCICDLSTELKNLKRDLACKLRESVSFKRQLDDMPIAEEVEQYEHRFLELNVHIQDRLQQTRKYYATYNALLEIKDLMLKEISLINSIDSQFQDAIGKPAVHTNLIDSMEAIHRGIQQKLEKVQPGLQAEHRIVDSLREQYTAAIANQRRCAALMNAFQEECKRNERLKEEFAKNGS